MASECMGKGERLALTVADLYPLEQAMAAKMTDPGIAASYRERASSIEPISGNVKTNRGVRAFLVRGLQRVSDDWRFETLITNMQRRHAATTCSDGCDCNWRPRCRRNRHRAEFRLPHRKYRIANQLSSPDAGRSARYVRYIPEIPDTQEPRSTHPTTLLPRPNNPIQRPTFCNRK